VLVCPGGESANLIRGEKAVHRRRLRTDSFIGAASSADLARGPITEKVPNCVPKHRCDIQIARDKAESRETLPKTFLTENLYYITFFPFSNSSSNGFPARRGGMERELVPTPEEEESTGECTICSGVRETTKRDHALGAETVILSCGRRQNQRHLQYFRSLSPTSLALIILPEPATLARSTRMSLTWTSLKVRPNYSAEMRQTE